MLKLTIIMKSPWAQMSLPHTSRVRAYHTRSPAENYGLCVDYKMLFGITESDLADIFPLLFPLSIQYTWLLV